MATFLDLVLFEGFFQVLFPFLLSFAVVLGILTYTKTFQEQRSIQALIAFVVAVSTLLSPTVRSILNNMAPWFVLLFVATIFIMIGVKTLGASDDDVISTLKKKE